MTMNKKNLILSIIFLLLLLSGCDNPLDAAVEERTVQYIVISEKDRDATVEALKSNRTIVEENKQE